MILGIRSDHASFHEIALAPGFNVILADRTKEETKKNSRNGLGKSTLIEIIHFCLGGDFKGAVTADALKGWTFTIDLLLGGAPVTASRNTETPNKVYVDHADTTLWPLQPKEAKDGRREFLVKEWNGILGYYYFGLPINSSEKHRPQFRSLISYFIRRGKDAYSKPFEFFRKQPAVSTQTLTTFLLGLDYRDAIAFQKLKDRREALAQLKRLTTETGTAQAFLGSLGELEAQKVRLEGRVRSHETDLSNFRVHPQYEEVAKQANALTEEIHNLANENVVDQRLAELYEQGFREEQAPESTTVVSLYEQAGVDLPGTVKKRLADVQQFHHALIDNRRSFLADELRRLEHTVRSRTIRIEERTAERAELMRILQTHGALEEYTKLQEKHIKTKGELDSVLRRIKNVRDLQEGDSSLKIDREMLVQGARRGIAERAAAKDRAIELFNANSQALYEAPGNLVVDVDDAGFRFKAEIRRGTSDAVGNMKVLCFDLTLAQLWSERPCSPGFLIHDSLIFDGVDERQRALAIELAAKTAEQDRFQYICTINSDAVPSGEFSEGFDFGSFVRLRLSDGETSSCLTGIRFELEDLGTEDSAEEQLSEPEG